MLRLLAGEVIWICVTNQLCGGEMEKGFQMGQGLFVETGRFPMGEISYSRAGEDGIRFSQSDGTATFSPECQNAICWRIYKERFGHIPPG